MAGVGPGGRRLYYGNVWGSAFPGVALFIYTISKKKRMSVCTRIRVIILSKQLHLLLLETTIAAEVAAAAAATAAGEQLLYCCFITLCTKSKCVFLL